MFLSNYSIQVNPRCYKCEVTSYYLKRMGEFLQSVVKIVPAVHAIPPQLDPLTLRPRTVCSAIPPALCVLNPLTGHLFEPQASCVPCSPPLAFFRGLRGTAPGIHQHPNPETVLRVPGATMIQPISKIKRPPHLPQSPKKETMFDTTAFLLTPFEH